MPDSLKAYAILIVDGPGLNAVDLRDRFASEGAAVHVGQTSGAAMALVRSRRIDLAMLGCVGLQAEKLRRELGHYGVQIVHCSTRGYATEQQEDATLQHEVDS